MFLKKSEKITTTPPWLAWHNNSVFNHHSFSEDVAN